MDDTWQEAVMSRVNAIILAAKEKYGVTLPYIQVAFNLRGKVAGRATRPDIVQFNSRLLAENKQAYIDRTVVHEMAHIIAWAVYGDQGSGHGVYWQNVMLDLGASDVKRCHAYDTSSIEESRAGYRYNCSCGKVRVFNSRRHKRIGMGAVFFCSHCKSELVFLEGK